MIHLFFTYLKNGLANNQSESKFYNELTDLGHRILLQKRLLLLIYNELKKEMV